MRYFLALTSLIFIFGSKSIFFLNAAEKKSSTSTSKSKKYTNILPKKSVCSELEADVAYLSNLNGSFCHIALYEKYGPLKHELMIITTLNDQKKPSNNGVQVLTYGKNNKEFSESRNWTIQNINGIIYTVFTHENCWVYSTDFSQFIIIKK